MVHVPKFLGKKKNSGKSDCHAQLNMGFQHHAKIKKKLTVQFQENAQTDARTDRMTEEQTVGWTDPIL